MPVLLLAQGDTQSKDMLRRAFEARYGFGAPSLDTIRADLKGRVRAHLGPLSTWLPVDVTIAFQLPTQVRWEIVTRPVGVPLTAAALGFDGNQMFERKGGDVTTDDSLARQRSLHAQIWAASCILLTPLTDDTVSLRAIDQRSFAATHNATGSVSTLVFNEDYTLASVSVQCLNVNAGREQTFSLTCSEGQMLVNDFNLPRKMVLAWDNEVEYELTPIRCEVNAPFEASYFRLSN